MANPTLETTDTVSRRKTLSCENFDSFRNKPSDEDLFVHDLRTPKFSNSSNSLNRSVLWNPNQKSPFEKAVETLETVEGSIKLHSLASIKLFIRIRREDLADEEQEALDPVVCSLIKSLNNAGRYWDALELLNVSSSRSYGVPENRYRYVVSPELREKTLHEMDLSLREEELSSIYRDLRDASFNVIYDYFKQNNIFSKSENSLANIADPTTQALLEKVHEEELSSIYRDLRDASINEMYNYFQRNNILEEFENSLADIVDPTTQALLEKVHEEELSSIYRDLRDASINEMYNYFQRNNILEESENSLANIADPTTQALLEKVHEKELEKDGK